MMHPHSKHMTGWKTSAAGALSILYGFFGYLYGAHEFEQAIHFIVEGLAILGIGHKIEKIGGRR